MNLDEQDEAAIFEEVLSAKSEQGVNQILNLRCGKDSTLRGRILSLLDSYHGGQYLERFQIDVFDDGLIGTLVGEFQIMELIGQGGMGDVYAARRANQPQEIVALKVIKAGMDSRQVVARFNLERSTLGQFNHPHIARFLDSGVDSNGRIYFAMELVQGISIVDYCDLHRMPIDSRLRLFLDVCSAISHAHGLGIIHRDIKPQNVLVTQRDGLAIAKVIDFGVAKALTSENVIGSRLTGAIQWIGTPRYVSPEQMKWSSDVDARTDVYALGVLLYEMVAGTTPLPDDGSEFDLGMYRETLLNSAFDFASQRVSSYEVEAAKQHAMHRSTTTDKLKADLRGNIDWILFKSIELDRDQRYSSVSDFARDIEAHLVGRAVSVHRPTVVDSLKRLKRRNPKRFSVAMRLGLVVCILGLFTLGLWQIQRSNKVRESIAKDLAHVSFVQDIQSASEFLNSGDVESARGRLNGYSGDIPGSYPNHFAVGFLRGLIPESSQTFVGHSHDILDMDVSPCKRWVASADKGGEIILWDRENGSESVRLHPSDKEVTRVRYSPEGSLLATAGQDRMVRLWDAENHQPIEVLQKHSVTVSGLVWSPDGAQLASGDRNGTVYIWDIAKRTCQVELPKQADAIRCMEWSPDGKYLAMAVKDIEVQVWETGGWTKVGTFLSENLGGALAIGFSPNDQYMVFGGYDCALSFVDLKSLSLLQKIQTNHNVWSIEFGRNLEVIVGENMGIVQVFQYSSPQNSWFPARLCNLGTSSSHSRAFFVDHDNDVLISALQTDNLIKEFRLSQILGYRCESMPTERIGEVPEIGSQILADADGMATIRDVDGIFHPLNFRASQQCLPACSKARKLIAIAGVAGGVFLVDIETWKTIENLEMETQVTSLGFSRSGESLSICGPLGMVHIWNLKTKTCLDATQLSGPMPGIGIFCPTADLFVSGRQDGPHIDLWDLEKNTKNRQATLSRASFHLCFHPKGDYLVVGEMGWLSLFSSDLSSLLWRAPLSKNSRAGIVESVCFSPDRDFVAILLRDGTVELWDLRSRSRLLALQTPTSRDNSERFQRWMNFVDPETLRIGSQNGKQIFEIRAK